MSDRDEVRKVRREWQRATKESEAALDAERAAHLKTRQELSMALAEHAHARAEVERLRREYDVRAVIERCPQHDAPTLVDGYQKGRVRIVCSECCDEDNERLRDALRAEVERLRDALSLWAQEQHSSLCYAPTVDGGQYGCVCDARIAAARAALAGAPKGEP